MIPASLDKRQFSHWQQEQAAGLRNPAELLAALNLTGTQEIQLASTDLQRDFPLRVPRSFVRRMRVGDPNDPLLRQVLPLSAEEQLVPGFSADPVDEAAARQAPGLLRKYRGRALLITTSACAIHCRYCFRREFPYAEHSDEHGRWQAALATLASDSSIEELILSGGDPLTLSDRRLTALTDQLRGIAHLRRLRIHTRQPIVLPARVDRSLTGWLASLPWPVAIVVHCNHPAEIDSEVTAALRQLRATGATVLNQSVLLAGINDDAEVLIELSQQLFAGGVLPYYLHLLDPVRGAAHFDVPEPRARQLIADLAGRLPGYLVPRLVREIPGQPAKTVISAGSTPP